MKLRPVTKLGERNTATTNKFDDDVMSANCDGIVIFLFMANLEQSGSRIPDAWSVKLTFSQTKNEKNPEKSLAQLSYYCFEQRYYFCQKNCFGILKVQTNNVFRDVGAI